MSGLNREPYRNKGFLTLKPSRSTQITHHALRITLALLILLTIAPHSATSHAVQGNSRSINGIIVAGRFLEVWDRQGSEQSNVYVNGLPITERRQEVSLNDGKVYETQWFERARFEAHPEHPAPNDVLLGLLGASLIEGRGMIDPSTGKVRHSNDAPFIGVSRPSDADGKRKAWFSETRHTVAGKIFEYWTKYGGLAQFGYPLSEPFKEASAHDGKLYEVQYFERNRFELHPEKAAPYEVELGLLGVQQYRLAPVPAASLSIAPPREITSLKDTMTIAMSQVPANLVPEFSDSFVSQVASRPIFLRVIAEDPQGNLYPELAHYAPSLENGGAYFTGDGDSRQLTVKIKLRQGIHWSDGAEVTARDVLYHHRLMLDPRAPIAASHRILHLKLYSVEAPDQYTLLTRYLSYAQAAQLVNDPVNSRKYAFLKPFVDNKRPVTDSQYNLALGALPEHVMGKIPSDKLAQSDFALQPVGNGPYTVQSKEWRGSNTIILVPSPKYNLTAPPILRRINIRVIADPTQAARLVATGEIDAVTRDVFAGTDRLAGYVGALDSILVARHRLLIVPSRAGDFLHFNLDRRALSDKRVRQGIAHGINRAKLLERYWFSKATALNSFIPPTLWASSANPQFSQAWSPLFPFKEYAYDPERAARLMGEAGYKMERDGYRYREGARLVIELSWATRAEGRRATDLDQLQADLKALGIEVRQKAVPASFYLAADGYLALREHDLALLTWQVGVDPQEAMSLYDGSLVPGDENGFGGKNYSGFRNARFDELARLAGREWERAKLAPLYAEMQSILLEELPSIPLTSHPVFEAHNRNLVGWEMGGSATPATYRAATFHFQEK